MKENSSSQNKQICSFSECGKTTLKTVWKFWSKMKCFPEVRGLVFESIEDVLEITVVIDQTSSIQDLFIKTYQVGNLHRQKNPQINFRFATTKKPKEGGVLNVERN